MREGHLSVTAPSAEKFLSRGARSSTTVAGDAAGCGLLKASPTMLCLGSRIRLTRPEFERLDRITGIAPVGVATRADLDAYVGRCKAHYWGVSKDTQFLHWLIDQERARLEAAA